MVGAKGVSLASFWALLLSLLSLICLGPEAVSAQNLFAAPPTMSHSLNYYYLNRLGKDLPYYSILIGRHVAGTNVYNLVNGIADNTNPLAAAALTSPLRGAYSSNSIGGKVSVDVFYKLLRCDDAAACSYFERIIIVDSLATSGPKAVLSVLKGSMGNTTWLINANQSAAISVLNGGGVVERLYKDETYNANLFYKVATPAPCSSASPQTVLGAIGEFEGLPQFACIRFNSTVMLLATDNFDGQDAMTRYGVDPKLCDGSLAAFYVSDYTNHIGPKIVALVQRPQAVPLYLQLDLPFSVSCNLSKTVELTLQSAVVLAKEAATFTGTAPKSNLKLPTSLQNLGLKGTCAPPYYFSGYGLFTSGQTNDLKEGLTANQVSQLVTDNAAALCSSAISSNTVPSRDSDEDACAQWFSGDPVQQHEAVIAYNDLDTTGPIEAADTKALNETCFNAYNLGVSNILPQVAFDFEIDRLSLLSSTEIKSRLDPVASNAASILALEVALASCGIVVARIIARSAIYRRQQVSSSTARTVAVVTTAAVTTLFNLPNFVLIYKSLENHHTDRVFTTVSTHQYKPSNYSAFILAETHAFVTVRGSAATAIIGLTLYALALFIFLYITWEEFSEIIKRKNEVARCLGHEALIADKDLAIEWRGAHTKLHDMLLPAAVKETGLAADVELMRRAVARKQLESGEVETGGGFDKSGHGLASPRGLGSPRGPYRNLGRDSPKTDLYPV